MQDTQAERATRPARTLLAAGVMIALAGAMVAPAAAQAQVSGLTGEPLTGEDLERATERALEEIENGEVTDARLDTNADDDVAYVVEVSRGTEAPILVYLNGDFNVTEAEETPDGLEDSEETAGAEEEAEDEGTSSETDTDTGDGNVGADDNGASEPLTGEDLERASERALEYVGGDARVTDARTDTNPGDAAAYLVEVRSDSGEVVTVYLDADFAVIDSESLDPESEDTADEDEDVAEDGDAENDEEDDAPISGDDYDRAIQAALEYIAEGQVTDTEVDDVDNDEVAFVVEITRDNGMVVEVALDEEFEVLGTIIDRDDDEDDDDDNAEALEAQIRETITVLRALIVRLQDRLGS